MVNNPLTRSPHWEGARTHLLHSDSGFDELEPDGSLIMPLGDEGWLLEVTPDGRLICQAGIAMEDVASLLSDGTPEDLGSDELAKQAKYYLQQSTSRFKRPFIEAGFRESAEMTEDYVAVMFEKPADLGDLNGLDRLVQWCRTQF